ncbi:MULTISPECIES: cobalamin-binding protein [Marinobacter]|uniref:cobalamin-binding protein n=1 Tax=Marinobacter TaxID=2742 RepID=UPI001C94ED3E|nr:cobalamin-binding protein [Marinobacter nauticus]MBY5937165.1 cobalamin-binding protein [Marinobacter nauticus]MBY5954592.1 cobalamin-binding protein [Marinobacter nauticus]MBY6008186.1 cobalamin-binding protein [Marinobacter nauticus]MBY6194020.1 cobalamin-binding protein [Marinobacter nauticus]MBY6215167.1 cobalamin-binding protein [Marinobacter nauticus]
MADLKAMALILGGMLLAFPALASPVCATDDLGKEICLEQPAQRIAALSPGATELAWAAGAGDQVVAVVAYSDYPPAAKEVTSVGSHTRMDMERLLELQPDLVIGWVTGNPTEQLATLREMGVPVFSIEPRSFEAVSDTIERLSALAGTEAAGFAEAERFRKGITDLRARFSGADAVPVFYQVWDEPLMTVNRDHLIGEMIELCGGDNVFGHLERLVPRISAEAVIAANPEAILAGGMGEENRHWLTRWQSFPSLTATERDNLFFIPPSLVQRPTPRMLEGTRLFCEKLEVARDRRP